MKTIKELINEGLSEVAATRDIQRQENIKRVYKDFPELKEIDNQIMDVRNSRFIAVIDKDESKENAIAKGKEAVADKLTGNIVKEIYVPGKIVNIVMK